MRYKLTQEMARFFATSRGFTFSSLRIVYGVSLQVMDLPVAPSVYPVSVKNPGTLPRVLRSGITNFLSTPFHFRISAISKFLPAQITAWGAVDPTNRESEASAQTEFFARVSATASSETIGNQAWYQPPLLEGAVTPGLSLFKFSHLSLGNGFSRTCRTLRKYQEKPSEESQHWHIILTSAEGDWPIAVGLEPAFGLERCSPPAARFICDPISPTIRRWQYCMKHSSRTVTSTIYKKL